MLNTVLLKSPDEKPLHLNTLDLSETLYITSDVESKFYWQKYFLEQSGGLVAGDPVLRANELWVRLLKSQNPSWKILDSNTLLFFIEKWMGEFAKDTGISISSKDRQGAYDCLSQLLPVLTHEEGHDAVKDWFDKNPEAYDSWSQWYVLSQYLWQHLRQKKMVSDDFVSGLLLHEGLPEIDLPPLVFDLGLQISGTESELILELSRSQEVTLLVPQVALMDDLSCYHSLLQKKTKAAQPIVSAQSQFLKLPSMLSEVKQAVAQVRLWLDSGVSLADIAITSPVIENYWPTLYEYLKTEGIAVNKPVVAPLSQSMEIHQWLSALKLAMDRGGSADLRQYYFTGVNAEAVSFKDYQKQFKNFYSTEDLQRDENFSKRAPKAWDRESTVSFRQFLESAFQYWPGSGLSGVESWISELDLVWTSSEELSVEKWMEFLQRFFSRKEKRIVAPSEEGLSVRSLSGIENDEASYLIFLGLSQQSLKSVKKTPISMADALSLKSLYGFYIDHNEREQKNQQLQWVQTKELSHMVMLYGETDFSGGFQTPSLTWLKGALASESLEMQPPLETRWDQLMKSEASPRAATTESWEQSFRKNLESEKLKENQWTAEVPNLSLSASMLEEYFKCPFRVLVQKGFGLRTVPSLDLDVDYQTRGVLLHKICELIIGENKLSLEDSSINEILARAKSEESVDVVDAAFWPYFENFYRKIARSFITFELEWRQKFPATKTRTVESKVSGFISPDHKNLFSTDEAPGSLPFRGKIDRIDEGDTGELVVLDYKTSAGGLFQYGSWLKKGLFQNIIYVLAVEEGLTDLEAQKVSGAFYFVLRDMERKRGIHQIEDESFLPPQKGKVAFEDLITEGKEILREQLKSISEHNFPTEPEDSSVCETCSWGRICRRSRAAL